MSSPLRGSIHELTIQGRDGGATLTIGGILRSMSTNDWQDAVAEFERLMTNGGTVEAIERFYADDAIVFENRKMARAGRSNCAKWEREQLKRLAQPPTIRVRSRATDPKTLTAFFELLVRYSEGQGRNMRLEEVLVQTWERGHIVQERYYYEGVVDESDDEPSPSTVMHWTKLGG